MEYQLAPNHDLNKGFRFKDAVLPYLKEAVNESFPAKNLAVRGHIVACLQTYMGTFSKAIGIKTPLHVEAVFLGNQIGTHDAIDLDAWGEAGSMLPDVLRRIKAQVATQKGMDAFLNQGVQSSDPSPQGPRGLYIDATTTTTTTTTAAAAADAELIPQLRARVTTLTHANGALQGRVTELEGQLQGKYPVIDDEASPTSDATKDALIERLTGEKALLQTEVLSKEDLLASALKTIAAFEASGSIPPPAPKVVPVGPWTATIKLFEGSVSSSKIKSFHVNEPRAKHYGDALASIFHDIDYDMPLYASTAWPTTMGEVFAFNQNHLAAGLESFLKAFEGQKKLSKDDQVAVWAVKKWNTFITHLPHDTTTTTRPTKKATKRTFTEATKRTLTEEEEEEEEEPAPSTKQARTIPTGTPAQYTLRQRKPVNYCEAARSITPPPPRAPRTSTPQPPSPRTFRAPTPRAATQDSFFFPPRSATPDFDEPIDYMSSAPPMETDNYDMEIFHEVYDDLML